MLKVGKVYKYKKCNKNDYLSFKDDTPIEVLEVFDIPTKDGYNCRGLNKKTNSSWYFFKESLIRIKNLPKIG